MSDMTEREHRVRELARCLWQQAGCPEGQDERFWHEAEAAIAAEEPPKRSRRSRIFG